MKQQSPIVRGLIAVGVASSILVTAGCASNPSTTSHVTIKFSGWVPGIENAVTLFNKTHKDITVDFTRIASADSKNLPSEIQAGTAPDVAQISASALPSYVIDKEVQDITSYVEADASKYTTAAWNGVKFSSKVYAVPQDSSPIALMYRKDLFQKYGISVPKAWDDYVADAKKLHEVNPNVYIGQFSPNEVGLWQADQLQAGQSWFGTSGDSWTVGIDGSKSTAAASRRQELLDNKLIKVEQMWTPEYWADINSGTIASINYAAWFPVILEQNAPSLTGDWAVAPSPSTSGDGPSSDLGGSVNVVTKNSKDAQQAAEFISWLNSDPSSLEILIKQGGLFPAAKAGFNTKALNATNPYWNNVNISKVFIAAAKNLSEANVAGPSYDAANAAVDDEFAKVANGQQTFEQALKAAAATTRSAIKQKGLSVK